MPTISDYAICIRRWDFSETSQTVSLFTRESGIIRGLAKGAKREKGKFSGGFDLLTLGQVVAIVKPGRDLATLTEWDLQDTNRHLRANLKVNKTALYIADLIHHMLTDHDPHQVLFDQLRETLDRMRHLSEVDVNLLHFQWNLLDEAGYRPQLDHDVETGAQLDGEVQTLAFSPASGGVVADTGAGGRWRVRAETVHILRQVAAGTLLESADPSIVERSNRLLAAYFRELIGSEPAAMRWRFGELMGESK